MTHGDGATAVQERAARLPSWEQTQERARDLIGNRQITYLGGTLFSIEGSKPRSGPARSYDVDIMAETCTCPWKQAHPFTTCKHVLAMRWIRSIMVQVNEAMAQRLEAAR